MNIFKNKKGFTAIEIILVIVILGIGLGLSILYLQTSQFRADINSQVAQFSSHVRLAQSNALSGQSDVSHGIHLEETSYTIFQGDAYSPSDPLNFEIEMTGPTTIQNISLNGGGSDIIFTNILGETDDYGTINFVSTQTQKTISVEITKFGTVIY
ncbi:MAG: prepilin-type N-terminal cleavage/methylation domain-containing protein [Nitrospirae bacterium]|nr:prepilin-type N-terminal cleavage/methylation domain-containing protein [Nitrospirota bacterium]